jgi:integrase
VGISSVGADSTTHDLRHCCASVLISSGVSIEAVQRYLGHKNASETLDTYGHLMPGDDDRLRAAIDASLRTNVRPMCDPDISNAR